MKLTQPISSLGLFIFLAILFSACDLRDGGETAFAGSDTKTILGMITYESIVTGRIETPSSVKVMIPNVYAKTFEGNKFEVGFVTKRDQTFIFECYELYGADTVKYKYSSVIKADQKDLGTILVPWHDSRAVVRARVMSVDGVPLPLFPVCLFADLDQARLSQSCSGSLANAVTNAQGFVLFTSVEAGRTYGLRTEGIIGTKNSRAIGSVTPYPYKGVPPATELKVNTYQKFRGSLIFHNLLTDRLDSPESASVRLTQTGMANTNPPVTYESQVKNGVFDIDVPIGDYSLEIKYIQQVGNEKFSYTANKSLTNSTIGFTDLSPISLDLADATASFAPVVVRYKSATGAPMPAFSVCVYPDQASADGVTDCTGALAGSANLTNSSGYALITGLTKSVDYVFKAIGKNGTTTAKGTLSSQVSGTSQVAKITIFVD